MDYKYILIQRWVEALRSVFQDGIKADKALEQLFRKYRSMGSRDRKWVAEHFYDSVRYFRRYAFCAQSENLWHVVGCALFLKEGKIPPFSDFKNLDEKIIKKKFEFAGKDSWIRESYPDYWKELEIKECLKERFPEWMQELNREAHACIRVNTLKITLEDLIKKLRESGIEVKPLKGMENVLQLPDKRNLFGTDEFQNGYFEFQDPGSVEVGKFCQVRPGMKVVDVCAGAGGKALQLAAEMKNKGIIVCTDIQDSKLRELRKRSARAGVNNIRIEHAVSEPDKIKAFTKKYRSYADVLLIDAPCSGSGVIKRNPDAKWRITEDFLNFTRSTQQHILHTYAEIVKPGGYLVYATCSIFPSENEKQIKQFLENNNPFVFVEEKMLYPSENNDGFYMCKLERK